MRGPQISRSGGFLVGIMYLSGGLCGELNGLSFGELIVVQGEFSEKSREDREWAEVVRDGTGVIGLVGGVDVLSAENETSCS